MARTSEVGLRYFSFDVGFFEKREVKLIEADHQHKGVYVMIRLLEKIYAHQGYFMVWGADACKLLASEIRVQSGTVEEVVKSCVKCGFFNEEVFNVWQVLTNREIQETYFSSTKRHKKVFLCSEIVLCEPKIYAHANIISINVHINQINVNIYSNPLISINNLELNKKNNIEGIAEKKIINDNINAINVNINSINDNIFKPPTLQEVFDVAKLELQKKNRDDDELAMYVAEKFFNYWNEAKWKQSSGMILKQWRARIQNEILTNLRNEKYQRNTQHQGSSAGRKLIESELSGVQDKRLRAVSI